MDKVQKNTFTDYNAPSSEPFRLNLKNYSYTMETASLPSHKLQMITFMMTIEWM
jgi:hypothetical protein